MANYSEKLCINCGSVYTPVSSTQTWCEACLTKSCENCGKCFRIVSKAHVNRAKYCSVSCKQAAWKINSVGENAPNYRDGNRIKSIHKHCKMCNMEYMIAPSHAAESNFCSRKCADKYRSRFMRGDRSTNWKGGIAYPRNLVMARSEYKEWRKKVFERDNFTCQKCGDDIGGNLQAHHIKKFSKHPELRYDVNNGVTLCTTCHIEAHAKKKLDIQSGLR